MCLLTIFDLSFVKNPSFLKGYLIPFISKIVSFHILIMSISENLELDLEDKDSHIESSKDFLSNNEDVFSFGATAVTLNSILEKSKAPKEIDFLSLDVEGAELEVLKGIDFDKFSFKYMLIEVRDIKRMESFLLQHGYLLEKQFSTHDYLFKHI